jgi:predicted transcriptional regulator
LLTNPLVDSLSIQVDLLPGENLEGNQDRVHESMPPKKSITLTEAELRLMKILWRRGESVVSDLVAAMPDGEALAYNSVLTTVRILEQKGYVEHRQEGRAFVYRPCVPEDEASRSEVRHVLSRFFGNSRERLLLSLLGDEEISREELLRLQEAIKSAAEDGAEGA